MEGRDEDLQTLLFHLRWACRIGDLEKKDVQEIAANDCDMAQISDWIRYVLAYGRQVEAILCLAIQQAIDEQERLR